MASKQSKVLWSVLLINLVMFFVEGLYGILANSLSLLADSLDMFGDAFVYGISLYALGRSQKWNASVSMVKGIVMMTFGLGVFSNAIYKFLTPGIPAADTMGLVATLAFIANFICAMLLLKHRNDDLNMQSTWLCSRNDVIANLGVLMAAGLVSITNSKYPDLLVGVAIATLVLKSSFHVLKESKAALAQ